MPERGSRGYEQYQAGRSAYDILGVSPTATQEEIGESFRALGKQYHPSAEGGGDEERFKEISEAYQKLKTAERREEYDASHGFGSQTERGGRAAQASTTAQQEHREQRRESRKESSRSTHRQERQKGSDEFWEQQQKPADEFSKRMKEEEKRREEVEIFERHGVLMGRKKNSLFSANKVFLINPKTRRPFDQYDSYDDIIVRGDLVIGCETIFGNREYLLDMSTGRRINTTGYSRIERRAGRIVGIADNPFGPSTVHDIRAGTPAGGSGRNETRKVRPQEGAQDEVRRAEEQLREARKRQREAEEELIRKQAGIRQAHEEGIRTGRVYNTEGFDLGKMMRDANDDFASAFTGKSREEWRQGQFEKIDQRWGITFGHRQGKIYVLDKDLGMISDGYDSIEQRGNEVIGIRKKAFWRKQEDVIARRVG